MQQPACLTAGAVLMAGEQYGEEVRVIDVPGVSMELCGGTHVQQTAQIGAFKILSESGIASGVRRVEAVAGPAAVDHLDTLDNIVKAIGKQLKAKNEDLPARVTGGDAQCPPPSRSPSLTVHAPNCLPCSTFRTRVSLVGQ